MTAMRGERKKTWVVYAKSQTQFWFRRVRNIQNPNSERDLILGILSIVRGDDSDTVLWVDRVYNFPFIIIIFLEVIINFLFYFIIISSFISLHFLFAYYLIHRHFNFRTLSKKI